MDETTNPHPNGLPEAPTRGCPVSAKTFDLLLSAARKGGWPAVFTVFAEGETVTESNSSGVYERPARRRTLAQFLDRRPELKTLIDSACQEKRDRLLNALESEVEAIALGPGDVTTDLRSDGTVSRTRVDKRNKLYAALRLLQAHDPATYAERRKIDTTVSGQIEHQHQHQLNNRPGYMLSPDDVLSLEPYEQSQLMTILERIEANRIENQNVRRLPPIETSVRVVDVESEDVPGDAG